MFKWSYNNKKTGGGAMSILKVSASIAVATIVSLTLTSCASNGNNGSRHSHGGSSFFGKSYESRLPPTIASKSKTILVDPNAHVWGAYRDGQLVKAGIATTGARFCPDIGRPCKTSAGTFRIKSLGSADCKSSLYPKPNGGAPMPYCMFFNGGIGLHGSHPGDVVEANVSHGCVRMRVADAYWVRHNFATIGTKVIVRPY